MLVGRGLANGRRISGLLLAVAAVGALLAACTSGGGTSEPSGQPPPESAAVSREEYVSAFNAINLRLLEDTRVMNRIGISASIDDQARSEAAETTRIILDDLNEQLTLLAQIEPVPAEVAEAHESLKTAVTLYIEAASLLLLPEGPDAEAFDFFRFQELVQEGGKNFHGAGSALSMESGDGEEGEP